MDAAEREQLFEQYRRGVAEVESGFDQRARSPVGAAGLFQLMPASAKRFGLRSWPRDQRYQPEPSARAAAQYLRYLHEKFGDWSLALAAYNAGEGTVQKLLERQKSKTFDNIANPSKIIVTTEKDAMRLRNPDIDKEVKKLPFFFLPIEVHIHQDGERFNKLMMLRYSEI